MYYSVIGFLASLILIITNHDVLLRKMDPSAPRTQRLYRRFLVAVLIYYVTDMLWGVLEALSMTSALYLDTELYFIAMAMGILFWTQYVNAYLENKNTMQVFLHYAGRLFFAGVVLLTVLNLFVPVMFWFYEDGSYQAGPARYIALTVQVFLLLLTAVYALIVATKTSGSERNRHLAIGLSGLIMLIMIMAQVFYPLLPLYAIGYMLSCCMLRTFVIENEKEEYRLGLETALEREKKQIKELNEAWKLAYTDSLTGAKSKLAYSKKEDQLDKAISEGTAGKMAVAVFDVNGLKYINDTRGHETGDEYIKSACRLICTVFKHSPVFRVGGDEFVSILEGHDYENREKLLSRFNRTIDENLKNDKVVVSVGVAEYAMGSDNSFRRVFDRADLRMYERKEELKHRSEFKD